MNSLSKDVKLGCVLLRLFLALYFKFLQNLIPYFREKNLSVTMFFARQT